MGNELKFGQRVIVDSKYSRWWKKCEDPRELELLPSKRKYEYKYWKEELLPINNKTGKSARNGIFLGYRTLRNGFVNRYHDGTTFDALESIKVALVCLSRTENPIYVPIKNMKLLSDNNRPVTSVEIK